MRKAKELLINFIRGFCMALADSVPGVSGGTIAFLLGFYDRFIGSLDDLFHGKGPARVAALSFLGLGAKPPTAEWGSMMSEGRSMLQTYPWVVLTPGIGIFISVALFNLLGDTLRDYMDPRNRRETVKNS